MRIEPPSALGHLLAHSLIALCLLGLWGASPAPAQDQPVPPNQPAQPDQGKPERRRPQILALKVGTVVPVDGPVIKQGVLLIAGNRILAVGPASQIKVPAQAKVLEFPDGYAYPGLVDALSTAFTDEKNVLSQGTNAGSDFYEALDQGHLEHQTLVQHGITTCYVANRSNSSWRGLGAIIRPQAKGFANLAKHRHGGLQMRLTSGKRASHPLDRQKMFANTGKEFDALDKYKKSFKEHAKALKKYEKDYQAYLDSFGKGKKAKPGKKAAAKTSKKPPAKPTTKPEAKPSSKAEEKPAKKEQGTEDQTKAKAKAKAAEKQPKAAPAKKTADSKKSKKPKYPKAPKKNPAQEALLRVRDGKLYLRVEAHQADEIRAALKMAKEKKIPLLALEEATQAGSMIEELQEAGAPVIITQLLPDAEESKSPFAKRRMGDLPAKLATAGIPVALASGDAQVSRHLPMLAAYAVGKGLPEEAGLRAITLTAAEILGIQDQVGSLSKGKLADVIITDKPLLHSQSRILQVFSAGKTQYQAP